MSIIENNLTVDVNTIVSIPDSTNVPVDIPTFDDTSMVFVNGNSDDAYYASPELLNGQPTLIETHIQEIKTQDAVDLVSYADKPSLSVKTRKYVRILQKPMCVRVTTANSEIIDRTVIAKATLTLSFPTLDKSTSVPLELVNELFGSLLVQGPDKYANFQRIAEGNALDYRF